MANIVSGSQNQTVDRYGNTMQVDQWGQPAYLQVNTGWGIRTDQNPMYGKAPQTATAASGAAVAAPATPTPAVASSGASSGAAITGMSDLVAKYLAEQQPQLSQTNRFEPALAQSQQRLSSLLDDPNSVQQSAAYKFRVGQGQEALQRQLAAKGLLGSGNRLMELTKYGQDMGSQEYGAQFDRLNSLNQGNAQSWLGDKGANTSQFSALQSQFADKGNLLNSLVGQQNQAQGTANQYDLGKTSNANQAQSIANTYELGNAGKLGWRY
jgi:hypothetical protein